MMELEAIVWCPKCQVEKYRVYRKKIREDIYTHEMDPSDAEKKVCTTCGGNLTRNE